MAPETAPRTAPIALWRAAGAFLEMIFQLFGNPAMLAAQHVLDTRAHALVCAWLRAFESMLRQLLLIEAAAQRQPEPSPTPRRARRTRRIAAPAPLLDAPESWRVSFRCFASHSGGAGGGFRERKSARRFHPAFPIAARMEAMLRAFNDPVPFARRLARRLVRRPHRVHELLRLPPDTRLPTAPRAAAEIEGLLQAGCRAALQFDTGPPLLFGDEIASA